MLLYNHTSLLRRKTAPLSWVALAAALLMLLTACQVVPTGNTGSADAVKLFITPVATPTATQAAQPTAAPVTYTVKSGDTLSGIADMFGVTVDDIVRSNNVADANSLQVGQTLTIPGRQSGTATAPGGTIMAGTPVVGATRSVNPATAGTVTPVLASPTVLPPDATPPQGPNVPEPQSASTATVGPTDPPTGVRPSFRKGRGGEGNDTRWVNNTAAKAETPGGSITQSSVQQHLECLTSLRAPAQIT